MEIDRNLTAKTMTTVAARKTKGPPVKYKKEEERKITHVFYHEKNLKTMPKIKKPTQVLHAYFQNNELTRIETSSMYNLTHLHLQWNKIDKIEGIDQLCKLRKLYLGNNRISVVENLDGLRCLEELYIQKQNVGSVDALCFDPRSLTEVGTTLRVLDVSDNKIENIDWIKPLRRLETLIARNNKLDDFNEVADKLCTLVSIQSLDFTGNPMCKKHRYKETLVARCCQLRVLDGTNISSVCRTFLKEFDRSCRLKQLNARNKLPPTKEGADDFFDLNMMEGPGSQSAYSLRPQPTNTSGDVGAPVLATDSSYTLVPRCFWRNRAVARAYRETVAEQHPEPPTRDHYIPSSINEQLEAFLPQDGPIKAPKKGILKKPMPMKYI